MAKEVGKDDSKVVEIVGVDDNGSMERSTQDVVLEDVVDDKPKKVKREPGNILKRSVGLLDYIMSKVQDMFDKDPKLLEDPETLFKALSAINKVNTDTLKSMVMMVAAFGNDNANKMFESIGLPMLNRNGSVAVPRITDSKDVNIESGRNSSFGGITDDKANL